MTARRTVVIDSTAPVWAKHLETDLNGIFAAMAAEFDTALTALGNVVSGIVPIGQIVDYTGTTLPAKFLWPNGQAVSRTTYAALFTAIGTTYGSGDGSTTFNLPDLRGRVAAGKDNLGGATAASRLTATSGMAGTTLGGVGGDERMQAHNHTYQLPALALLGGSSNNVNAGVTATTNTSTSGAGGSQNVQPTIVLNKIIYAGA